MTVVVAGGSGLIGRHLVAALAADGTPVVVLSRRPDRVAATLPPGARAVGWDGRTGGPWTAELADVAAVVNLAGATIGHWPWTAARKRLLVASRVDATRAIVTALAALEPARRPPLLINASGTDGYDGQDEVPATEATPFSDTFLARLCTAWEAAALPAEALGLRLVRMRQAVVIARGAPALRLLALPVRLFVGGPLGGGQQWFSWIAIEDLVGLYRWVLARPDLAGALNAAAPEPVRQAEVARVLGHVLHRPARLPTPALAVRLSLGEMSTLALGSRRVWPQRALDEGYVFVQPSLEGALSEALG